MPDFTVTLSAQHIDLIQAHTAAYNEDNGTALTAKQWTVLMLKRLVLGSQILAARNNARMASEQEGLLAADQAEQALLDSI